MKTTQIFILLFFSLIITSFTFHQKEDFYTKEEILKNLQIEIIKQEVDTTRGFLWVINGVPYQNEVINEELEKYNKEQIASITFLGKDGRIILCHQPKTVILIVTQETTKKQNLKTKKTRKH